MVRRSEPEADPQSDPIEPANRDERLGEAIEEFLELVESGESPDPEVFAGRYPDLGEDLVAALDGLAMVQGLVGETSGPGTRLEAGRRVAGYRIVRELGRGGMGIVYEAVHVDLDRPVALKVLGMHATPDSTGRRRFLNEAKTAAGLHHTHIVPVFDVGQVGGLCYYAMQRIEGCGLDRVVKALRKDRSTAAGSVSGKRGAVTSALDDLSAASLGDPTRSWLSSSMRGGPRDERHDEAPPFEPPRGSEYYRWVARAGSQAAEALAHAHRRGVIHRDIKPSNLLVDARGTVWVADFGLARRLADPAITQTDSLLGTPRYMSPEQAELGPIDGLADVYSLGATLYELLTLRPSFDGRTAAELVTQIRSKEPIPPRKIDPRLPRDLETIVLKAMAKRPQDRYSGAAELSEDLQRFLALEPVKARRIGPVGRAWRFARRHPSLTAVTTIAATAILATATIAYVRVVQERNIALTANGEKEKALDRLKGAERDLRSANKKQQTAMRKQLWREASGVRVSRMPDLRKTGLAVLKEAVALGPDPEMTPRLRDEAVRFLALRDIEPRPHLETGKVRRLIFAPGTNRLATLSGSELSIWDVARRVQLTHHRLSGVEERHEPGGPGRRPQPWWASQPGIGLAILGDLLAVTPPSGEGVRLLNVATDTLAPEPAMIGRKVVNLFSTASGRRLVTVEQTSARGGKVLGPVPEPYRVSLWDIARETPMATLMGGEVKADGAAPRMGPRIPIISCSPDGKTIATAWLFEPEITLWNAETGQKRATIATEANTTSIAIGPDGVLAAAATNSSVARWEVETQRPLPGLSIHQPFVRNLQFSPDGSMLAISGAANVIEIWDPEANSLLASVPTSEPAQDLAFSPDGRSLVAAVGNATRVWAVVDPIGRMRLAAPESRPASRLLGLGFSPTGALAASFTNDKTFSARLQCTEGGLTTLDRLQSPVLSFAPDGRLIVPDGENLDFYRSPRDKAPAETVELPLPPPNYFFPGTRELTPPKVNGAARSADGRTQILVRGAELLLARFQDDRPPTITPLQILTLDEPRRGPGRGPGGGHPEGGRGPGGPDRDLDRSRPVGDYRTLALSPSGDHMYMLAGDSVSRWPRAWIIQDDQAIEVKWKGVPRDVARLALSADGRIVALARHSGEVILVDAAGGSYVGSIPAPAEAEPASAMAFSPEGVLAVGFRSGVIHLWSLPPDAKPQFLVSLPAHQSAVTSLVYAPDGRLAAGDDSGADIWDLRSVRKQLEALGLGW